MDVGDRSRRELLRLLTSAACIATLGPWRACAARVSAHGLVGLAEVLARLFTRPASARIVGFAYLEARPEEADIVVLLQRILGDAAAAAPTGAQFEALPATVAARKRADFVEGRLVNVGGWLLSETEGRLCALVALL